MRRIGLYSLIAFASLALIGVLAAGVGGALNRGDEAQVSQANTPTVSEPPAPETVPEETEEEQTKEEGEAAEQEAADQEASEQAAAEQEAAEQEASEQAAAEQEWREIAEQRASEQEAADQLAAEEAAAAEEQAAAEEAAAAVPANTALNLTVPKIGLQNNPVTDSVSESVLANGAGKIPSTGFPWQEGANTYIAAHVYGYPGTGSWQQFAGLPNMVQGDQVFLTDSGGTTYEYRVTEILTVAPTDVWVAQSTGQNMVSLQTCVGPGWSERLVVRAEMVGTTPA